MPEFAQKVLLHQYLVLFIIVRFLVLVTVLPPNSRFLGPGFFCEFEIREFKIHNFPPNSL